MDKMRKVILDTDIGNDIDDAIALSYLLSKKECELLGITTVSGESENRAKMASAICMNVGRDIPIYPGTELPIMTAQRQAVPYQKKKLGNWQHKMDYPQFEAVEFMRRTIRQYPGEITLLAIGPMTNVGLLFAIDPEIPGMLKELVTMSGVFDDRIRAEWNVICDPYAAYLVYNADVKAHYSIGLDVTMKVQMHTDKDDIKNSFSAKVLQPVVDFTQAWMEHSHTITFHDPLAAVTMFCNDICEFKRGKVQVDYMSTLHPGMTTFTPDENGNHYVALKVDPDKFFNEFFGAVGK